VEKNLGFLKELADRANCCLKMLTDCVHYIVLNGEMIHWTFCDKYFGGDFISGKEKALFYLFQKHTPHTTHTLTHSMHHSSF
jgi:hypothetical protein